MTEHKSAETKAHILALHGGFVAAVTSSLGLWLVPWIVVCLQATIVLVMMLRDRAGVSHD